MFKKGDLVVFTENKRIIREGQTGIFYSFWKKITQNKSYDAHENVWNIFMLKKNGIWFLDQVNQNYFKKLE